MDGLTCCRRCRGAHQICRWHPCPCHTRSAEKNLSYSSITYPTPTEDAALRNLENQPQRNKS